MHRGERTRYVPRQSFDGHRQVCRLFSDLIHGDLSLQYRIELPQNGMVDGHRTTLPVSDRLQRLRQCSSNFANGAFDHEDLGAHPDYLIHLRNRRWNTTIHDDRSSSSLHSQNGKSDLSLCVITPGSAQAGIESSLSLLPTGTASRQGFIITKWAIDGIQDLLVMAERVDTMLPQQLPPGSDEVHIHFYSLSGSKADRPTPHPAAKLPSVRVSAPGPDSRVHNNAPLILTIVEIHISGQKVISEVVEIRGGNIEAVSVSVCSWRTGEAISQIDVGLQLVHVVPLGPDCPYFLVVPRAPAAGFHLTIYNFSPSSTPGGPILCTLQLPPLNPGERIAWHDIHSGDRPLHTSEGHFHADLSLSLIALTLGIMSADAEHEHEHEHQAHLLIPRTTLLTHARAADSVSRQSADASPGKLEPRRVPWAEWGPRGCLRLRQRPPAGLAARRVMLIPFGARMPLVVFDSDERGLDASSVWVYVFDLNPFLPRRRRVPEGTSGTGPGTTGIIEDIEAVLPGVVDPACSSIRYRAYRFRVGLPAVPIGNSVRSVVMGMTGFTMKLSGVSYEEAVQTWSV
ncbi:hypothetical protein GSI_02725 [Ganoderma sinense ZZ0214-1]|uniref:Uncharacterized protein n=1 Tax=Ganoderma sinense ZZ0214-1 TaxID=1077348 RepID=A0A2G8SMY6_9APHY|nr:hypothetical protein GSI_02725 [Ganoderma sinense ZZ0214-1]